MKASIITFSISAALLASLSGCVKDKPAYPTNPGTKPPTVVVPPTVTPTNPLIVTPNCDYILDETALTTNGWSKLFDDSFTGDLNNWYRYTGGDTNQVMCYQPENAKIVNGELQIAALKEEVTGPVVIGSTTTQKFSYTSGSLVSNKTFAASTATPKLLIVARVKLPAGYGLTSVFNSYGQNWPTNGQINFFQLVGNDTKQYATNYFYGDTPAKNVVTNGMQYNRATTDLTSCYHTFATEWTQTSIKYYLDGNLVETKTGSNIEKLFNKQQSLSLSLPVGGNFYLNFNPADIQLGTLQVSYVKVYSSK